MSCNANLLLPLPIPPSSCQGVHDLKIDQKEYKGPWVTMTNLDIFDLKPTYLIGVADISDIPESFTWKDSGNKIEDGSRNQKQCGGCWSFATVSVLGDRYALKYNIEAPYPSAAYLLSCGTVDRVPQGCCGGNVQVAALYLTKNGTKLESCWPFSMVENNNYLSTQCLNDTKLKGCCLSCCNNDLSKPQFTVEDESVKPILVLKQNNEINVEATIAAVQRDIIQNGPITASIKVPGNFQDWWLQNIINGDGSNVFVSNGDFSVQSGHAVVIAGWGVKDGKRYWDMRNSWGSPGWCKFAFSTDTPEEARCGIDTPFKVQGSWQGGCVSFKPGPLPSNYNFNKGSGKKIEIKYGGGNDSEGSDKKSFLDKNKTYILIIIGFILLTGLIIFLILR